MLRQQATTMVSETKSFLEDKVIFHFLLAPQALTQIIYSWPFRVRAIQTWAEAGVSRSRSLLNFTSRSRSLDSFKVRSRSQSLCYEAEAKARLFVENRMQIWASRIRIRIRIQVPRTRIQMNLIPPLFSWIQIQVWIQLKKLWTWIRIRIWIRIHTARVQTDRWTDFQSRSFGKPRSRSLWRSQSRSQAPKNLGSRSRSLDPKKAGFVKPKPATAHVWGYPPPISIPLEQPPSPSWKSNPLLIHNCINLKYIFGKFSGCPFKHSDVDLLRQKLESCSLSKSDAAEVCTCITLIIWMAESEKVVTAILVTFWWRVVVAK